MLAGIGGTESYSSDIPEAGGQGIELRAGDFKMLSPRAFWPTCGCPDIAYTKAFRSEGLGYVGSPEFAEAIRAVANGASEYSPAELPPDWELTAANWTGYVEATPEGEIHPRSRNALFQLREGTGELKFPSEKDACTPALVHLASLEYIKTQGRRDLTPVSPLVVQAATRELEEIVVAKRKMAGRNAARAKAIASMILEAERKVTGNCSPGEIARAKRELEQAFLEARSVRSPLTETVSSFDLAERIAASLLEKRLYASPLGGVCQ
jgi:hypothetical protein